MSRLPLSGKPMLRILAVWMLPTALFLLVYRFQFHASLAACVEHLVLMLVSALAGLTLFACGASALRRLFGVGRQRAVTVIAHAGTALTMVWTQFWGWSYLAMLLGLLSWGRIPTDALLAAYTQQWSALLRIIDLPGSVVVAMMLAIVVALGLLAWLTSMPAWIIAVTNAFEASSNSEPLSRRKLTAAVATCCLLSAGALACWYALVQNAGWASDEPVRLALDHGPRPEPQSLFMNRAEDGARIRGEEQSRADYARRITGGQRAAGPVRNVVLITVDALRPDHLGVYGYPRDTTPRLAALQQRKQLWLAPEARAGCAESACGLLGLASGKEPHDLLTQNFGLADALALHGYRTTLLLSGDHTNFYRLRESYGTADLYLDGTHFAPGRMNDDYALLERLRQLPLPEPGRPQFMFFHLMSVHGLGDKHAEHRHWSPAKTLYGTFSTPITPESIAQGQNSYDHGVRQVDWVIGEIIDELTRRGVLDDHSILLLTADHGESLGQHGIKTHAESLYESVIRIPWIWIGARPPYSALDTPAIQADFAPTVLRALGLPIPGHWSGVALQEAPAVRRTFHAQPPLAAVIDYEGSERRKLIINVLDQRRQMFDLRHDSDERSVILTIATDTRAAAAEAALLRLGYGNGIATTP